MFFSGIIKFLLCHNRHIPHHNIMEQVSQFFILVHFFCRHFYKQGLHFFIITCFIFCFTYPNIINCITQELFTTIIWYFSLILLYFFNFFIFLFFPVSMKKITKKCLSCFLLLSIKQMSYVFSSSVLESNF